MSSQNHIKKVAIVGASGNSGSHMAEELLKTGQHSVTAITRSDSTANIPSGVNIAKVDYDEPSTIVAALQGHDALVITMGVMAPKDTIPKLINAALEAGVGWILPNEWGPDSANDELFRDMMFGSDMISHRKSIADSGKSAYIAVCCGFWYEWSLAIPNAYGIDFAERKVVFFGDGDVKINTSTWPQLGRAVAKLLSLKIELEGADDKGPTLSQFKNKHVYVSSFTVSQKDMLESVMRVTNTKIDDWTITKEDAKQRWSDAVQAMKGGDRAGFVKAMYTRNFFPEAPSDVTHTKGLSDDLLGLPKEDIDEATKVAIARSKEEMPASYKHTTVPKS